MRIDFQTEPSSYRHWRIACDGEVANLILDVDEETAFVLGLNGQIYLDQTWSLLAEWILSEAREDLANDGVAFGFEIATAGHGFKFLVTNQSKMNPTHFLAGSDNDFTDTDDWRLGFNVTRRLPY